MTDVVSVAGAALTAPPSDPVLQAIVWLVAVVIALLAIGKPLKDYVRGERRNSKEDMVDDAKSAAEITLYTHLSQQVTQYRQLADSAFQQNTELNHRIAVLEAAEKDHARVASVVDKMKKKLDEKDAAIASLMREASEDRNRFFRILEAKEDQITSLGKRQKELEARLSNDERNLMFACPYHNNMTPAAVLPFSHDTTCTKELCNDPTT